MATRCCGEMGARGGGLGLRRLTVFGFLVELVLRVLLEERRVLPDFFTVDFLDGVDAIFAPQLLVRKIIALSHRVCPV